MTARTNTSTTSYSVNGLNEVTSCGYDANGNRTNGPSGTLQFQYDDENRLTTYIDQDPLNPQTGKRTGFAYDGLGRLRGRTEYTWYTPASPSSRLLSPTPGWRVQSVTTYIYDGKRVIQERNASNVPQVSYTRGTDLSGSLEGAGGIGGLPARSHGYSAGSWSTHNYYHADGNGNITYLVNSSQGLAASYRYDPFGNKLSQSGTLATANVYRFSSKEVHVNSGLYYYGYRFYDPNLQRWVNRDPLADPNFVDVWLELLQVNMWSVVGGGLDNLYTFAENSPVAVTDPNGLKGATEPPRSEPKCYSKNDIPKEIWDKLSKKQKKRLNKSCHKIPCTHVECCPGILAGGGIMGGFCIKCSF
jgi:RHS repeat-associated protein